MTLTVPLVYAVTIATADAPSLAQTFLPTVWCGNVRARSSIHDLRKNSDGSALLNVMFAKSSNSLNCSH